jgi:hypothetical protein
LSSAGPVPAYYWLVRQSNLETRAVIREFLLYFERMRKDNRDRQIKGTSESDNHILSRYDTLNRSINDVGSHAGRLEILQEELNKWVASKPLLFEAFSKSK